jgi:hypothetical protein
LHQQVVILLGVVVDQSGVLAQDQAVVLVVVVLVEQNLVYRIREIVVHQILVEEVEQV